MDRRDLEDLFSRAGTFTIKRMFGGHGIMTEDRMFALEARGEIYLKVDAQSAAEFEARGLRVFSYETSGGVRSLPYRLMPEEAHEDDDVLRYWCALAIGAARRTGARKAAPKARGTAGLKAAAKKKPAKEAAGKAGPARKSPGRKSARKNATPG